MRAPATEFSYRAVDSDGQLLRGTVLAADADRAVDRLRRQGLRPVAVERRRFAALYRERRLAGSAAKRGAALALFARQFATMTRAGAPLLDALSALGRQVEDTSLADAIAEIRADVENGDSLSVAMSHRPDWFDGFAVSMVEAGERAGDLGGVLERLAQTTERSVELRRKVRRATAYPKAVAGMVVLVVAAMLVFLVPTFTSIYEDLDGELPLPTRLVTGVSDLIASNAVVVVAVVVAAIIGFRRWQRTDAGRVRTDHLMLHVPVAGPLVRRTALARFSRTLGVLITSGVPIAESLTVAAHTADNEVVRQAVDDIAERVTAGNRISDAMEEHAVFTPMVCQMVRVGEDTGALDEMLGRVTELYDAEVDTTVESLTASLEPLLIVVMGVVVGGILLAVYLPMFRAIELVR